MNEDNNNFRSANRPLDPEENLENLELEIQDRGEYKRYIGLNIGNDRCIIPLENVVEIGNVEKTTYLPNVPKWIKGVFNFRGDIVSAIGFSEYFDVTESSNKNFEKMIIVKSLNSDITTALFVDSIIKVFNVYEDEIENSFNLPENKLSEFISGKYVQDNEIINIFNIEKYLDSPEVNQFN